MTMSLMSLAEGLKTATRQAHEDTEHSTFMEDLLEGRLSQDAFVALQQQSLLFYTALENAVDHFAADPRFDPVNDRRLDRAPRLQQDLAQLGVAHTVDTIEPLPATARYIDALDALVASDDVYGLIAHHYVRYLGDLSGGQVIARRMQRHHNIPVEALSFYSFADVGKLKPYKDQYRAGLNLIGNHMSAEEIDHMLAHANHAFRLNGSLFAQLGELHQAA